MTNMLLVIYTVYILITVSNKICKTSCEVSMPIAVNLFQMGSRLPTSTLHIFNIPLIHIYIYILSTATFLLRNLQDRLADWNLSFDEKPATEWKDEAQVLPHYFRGSLCLPALAFLLSSCFYAYLCLNSDMT